MAERVFLRRASNAPDCDRTAAHASTGATITLERRDLATVDSDMTQHQRKKRCALRTAGTGAARRSLEPTEPSAAVNECGRR